VEVHAKKNYKYSTTGSTARASKYVGEYKKKRRKKKRKKTIFLILYEQ